MGKFFWGKCVGGFKVNRNLQNGDLSLLPREGAHCRSRERKEEMDSFLATLPFGEAVRCQRRAEVKNVGNLRGDRVYGNCALVVKVQIRFVQFSDLDQEQKPSPPARQKNI